MRTGSRTSKRSIVRKSVKGRSRPMACFPLRKNETALVLFARSGDGAEPRRHSTSCLGHVVGMKAKENGQHRWVELGRHIVADSMSLIELNQPITDSWPVDKYCWPRRV